MKPIVLACIASDNQYDFAKKTEEALRRGAKGLEFRFDSLKDLTEKFVENVIQQYKKNAIIVSTFRHIDEAGPNKELYGFKGTEKERLYYIQTAIKAGTNFYDIEAMHYKWLNKQQARSVISWHEFVNQINDEILERMYIAMKDIPQSNVLKLVIPGNDKKQVQYVNDLLNNSSRNLVVIAMGELGQSTRENPNSYFTYTTLEKNKGTAKGQLTLEQGLELFPYEKSNLFNLF